MKAKCMSVFAFLVLLMGISFAAATYFPEKINFQGYLTDSSGTALNGSYDITLKLYSSATGGTALGTDTHTAVTVTNGVFNVQLGENLTAGWSANFTNNSSLYLGTTVGTDTELSPRILFVAVPYAFMAKNVSGESVVIVSTAGRGVDSTASQTNGVGVYGSGQRGLVGSSEGTDGTAVYGAAYGATSMGVYGYSVSGDGVRGETDAAAASGVFGETTLKSAFGVSAVNTTATTGTHAGAALLVSGKIKAYTGTNKPVGTGTIAGANTSVVIANTSVSADSLIFLSVTGTSAYTCGGVKVSAITADVGFTVSTMNNLVPASDGSSISFNYLIIN